MTAILKMARIMQFFV